MLTPTGSRCAAEAVAVETRPALTGEGALGVVADGIAMATARLALIDICVTERKRENHTSFALYAQSQLYMKECTSVACY